MLRLPADVLPNDWYGPLVGSLVAFGLAGVVLLAVIVYAVRAGWRAHVLARSSSREGSGRDALRPGAALLRGRVESDPDPSGPLVTVTITQQGTEQRVKNGWEHFWRESARKTVARPFAIVLDDGTRVRVDPEGGPVLLVAPLERTERVSHTTRERIATLASGTTVHAAGVLAREIDPDAAGRDYRSAGESLVLRAPDRRALELSHEPLARRHMRRARVHFVAAAALGVLGALLHGVVLSTFERVLIRGRVESVVLTWPTVETEHRWFRGGYGVHHYFANGIWRDANRVWHPIHGEVNATAYGLVFDACSAASIDDPARMEFLVVPDAPRFYGAGRHAGLPSRPLWFTVMGLIAALAGYALAAYAGRGWYDGRPVVEGGSGRL